MSYASLTHPAITYFNFPWNVASTARAPADPVWVTALLIKFAMLAPGSPTAAQKRTLHEVGEGAMHAPQQNGAIRLLMRTGLIRANPLSEDPQPVASHLIARPERSMPIS